MAEGERGGAGGRARERGTGEEPRLRGPWWYAERRTLTEEQREHLLGQLFFEGPERGPFLRRFAALLALSVIIAVFGLAADSAPVVIGAMLISPLATPLLGLSAALVMGWPRRQLESLAILGAGTAGAVCVAALALLVVPEPSELTLQSQELLARTEPSLLDLGVAIVAGAAGAYVLVRREAIGALPGVAIAVALVPPIAAVGMTLELGEARLAEEALLLYLTNVAGIVLAGAVVLLAAGVRPDVSHRALTLRIRVGLAAAILAVAAVAYPLVIVTGERVREATNHDTATEIAREWLAAADLSLHTIEVEEGRVHAEIAGPERPPPLEGLAAELAAGLDEPVSLTADWIREHRFEVEAAP